MYTGWGAEGATETSNKEGSAVGLEPALDAFGARGFAAFGFFTAAVLEIALGVRLTAFLGLPVPATDELVISDSSMC